MAQTRQRILDAAWLTTRRGMVRLMKDWNQGQRRPPLYLMPGRRRLRVLEMAPPLDYAKRSGYYATPSKVTFVLWPETFTNVDLKEKDVYVAGTFNGWHKAIGKDLWRMKPQTENGVTYLTLARTRRSVSKKTPVLFKFVTEDHHWLEIPYQAPNRHGTGDSPKNFEVNFDRSGRHVFYFEPDERHSVLGKEELMWEGNNLQETCPIDGGDLLMSLQTPVRLGAMVDGQRTYFRLFAPRAASVKVNVFHKRDESDLEALPMRRLNDSLWERSVPRNLDGAYYYFTVDGENRDAFTHFDPKHKVLDPYARACLGRFGPGIVLSDKRFPPIRKPFQPPAWQDLIILETHVRDLIAHAELKLGEDERKGFTGLAQWLRSDYCYLKQLGINAVELQPVQEFDNNKVDEYHWGYMTNNWFSPESTYSLNPEKGSQVEEFRDLIAAFHEQGLAVILDVVYNHVGEPAHLLFVDKQYYFETNAKGDLMNFSGCGNDFKAWSPMSRKLIIDSLIHLIKAYDIDGFRFDLAELLGVDVLCDIEKALKEVKPSVILIAEPWSFRGHIADALRHTGWASWNDGYRDFARKYVCGNGNRDGARYFLSGSPHYFAMFPAQTVNYVASHDDRCWIDVITENARHDGAWPTQTDRRRTHLMAAYLLCSIGIPMLAQGVDFLHSKRGVNNTYQRGDLNALHYSRQRVFSASHVYFRDLIAFRLSDLGRALRRPDRPPEGYLRFFEEGDNSALAMLYNANDAEPSRQVLFAINPHPFPVYLPMRNLSGGAFTQIADHERVDLKGLSAPTFIWKHGRLHLPGITCGIWVGNA